MNSSKKKSILTDKRLFSLVQLNEKISLESFHCQIDEYNNYLFNEAIRSQKDQMALTWLLRERSSEIIVAYMSLISDAIKLSATEKELHQLDYHFKTIPAMKIAKLAVSTAFQQKYKGIGTLMIEMAIQIAESCNEQHFACRFITVDADIEHNETVFNFYEKNGFIPNEEIKGKNRKTISMRRDILFRA
ncbi:MAG: GNAT family N-acetyltransferase [Treponema sp.]|nr:GNAT family N-acetyltransferase [Treponema sp.]MCL2250588.1 GNAT family N-acetyltransferase [Treponema sp.]